MNTISLFAAVLFFSAGNRLPAQDERQVTALLRDLKGESDLVSQDAALSALATSLDPRIPAACLPLLQSPGTSVQRNAARAIGSRWHQIANDELAPYTQALKANLESGDPALQNMTRRGLGLLNRTYDNDMFSRSRNGRWVVYERRKKPCLIDTRNHTEELLGASSENLFLPAIANRPVTRFCLWHPRREMVALQMTLFRRPREVWVWKHPDGLHPILTKDLLAHLIPPGGETIPEAWFSADFKSWVGNALEISVEYSVRIKTEVLEKKARILWDSGTGSLSVVPDSKEK